MAYISFVFARFGPGNDHSSAGAMVTAAFFGALLGLSLGVMFANRNKRHHKLSH